jgi:hypothetical protein
MPATIRSILLGIALASFALGASGCATRIQSRLDETADFDRYRTWGWGVAERAAGVEPTDEQLALARGVAREIDALLGERGFVYAGREADLLVTPQLRIQRRHIVMHRSRADQFVPSLHGSPSYMIEGLTTEEIHVVEVTVLDVVVSERATGRVVWHARMRGTFEDSFAPHVGDSVAAVMQSLPASSSLPGGEPAAAAIARADAPDEPADR